MALSLLFLHLTNAKGLQVRGESEDGDYEGYIEVEDLKWGLEKSAVGRPVASSSSGKADKAPMRVIPSLLEFTKAPDAATTTMMSAIANGEIMKEAKFILTERSELEPFHLVITFTDVRLTSYELDASDEELSLTMEESWEMTYRTVKFLYEYDGKHEVLLERPAGADDVDAADAKKGGGVDDLVEQVKRLSKNDLARLKNAIK